MAVEKESTNIIKDSDLRNVGTPSRATVTPTYIGNYPAILVENDEGVAGFASSGNARIGISLYSATELLSGESICYSFIVKKVDNYKRFSA